MERDRDDVQWEERLSAFVDGELHATECSRVVDRLIEDDELRGRWARHHAVRACLQGAAAPTVAPGFSARVSAAVAAEPVVIAPCAQQRGRANRTRPFAGLAIAATAALVALGALVALQQGGLERAVPGAGGDGGVPSLAGSVTGVRLAGADVYATGDGATSRPAVRKRLSMYLMSHNRVAGARDMPAVMPTSRMAGFNAGQ